jgi:two-component system cell cycle sensor histidine kinase/response regulator CckA
VPGASTDAEIVASVADALPVGVWVARAPGGEFVYANATFREIMGMGARADVALGEYATPYAIHGRDGEPYPEHAMPFVRALAERTTVMVDDIVIHRGDGGRVNIRAYARPHFDGDTITHVVIAFFDITREVQAEQARAESELRVQRAQRMDSIGMLAGGIAHDFNNLLTVIRVMTSSLTGGELDPGRRGDLEAIAAAADSAVSLTRALLGFAGQGKNLATPVAIDDVVGSVAEIFARATVGRIELATELRAQCDVVGDRAQLEQVFMNLLINARDAVAGRGRISASTRSEGDRVILEIADDGPGVPVAIRERIFEPYFSTKHGFAQGGTGLGLATVYGIVEAHHGTIEVLDAEQRGALFRVVLPASTASRSAPRRSTPAAVTRGSGVVLVVDDHPALRVAARRILESAGYRVLLAEDGVDGVETFRAHKGEIRLVLLDMSMPRLDGRGAFAAMRAIDPNVRVVLTTGYSLNDEVQTLLDQGAAAFIAKPFDVAELTTVVGGLIGS